MAFLLRKSGVHIMLDNLEVSHDKTADVLYLSFGTPRPGIAVEVHDGIFVRVDPFTDVVVGITVMDVAGLA